MDSTTTTQRLPRVLGIWTATALVAGTVIGSGIFKKPQAVSNQIPEFGLGMLAWALGGLLALLGALALAEVAALVPRAGGNYAFLREGFGRLAGFLWGWVEFWIIRTGSIAALATIFSESLHDVLCKSRGVAPGQELLSFWSRQGLTATVILGLALVNVRGVRWGGVLQLFLTIVKVASLLGVLLLPFIVVAVTATPAAKPSTANLHPIWPSDWSGFSASRFAAAMVGVVWAYHGWMNVGWMAEEVREPQKNIPRSLLFGVGLVTILYLAANLAYYLVIPAVELKTMKDPSVAAQFAQRLIGGKGGLIASAAVMISVFGALNGNLMVGPRVLFAMADDRMAPRWLRGIHPRFQTPAAAILLMAAWAALMVVVVGFLVRNPLPTIRLGGLSVNPNFPSGKDPFDIITDFAMFGALLLETLTIATIFVFRRRDMQTPRVYRCPGYPIVPILYIVLILGVPLNMFITQTVESVTGMAFILVGTAIYIGFLRRRAR
jgi:amino acid transporter